MALKMQSDAFMLFHHFTVRTPHEPFTSDTIALTTWRGLKKIFPQVGAAVLMPDHLHVFAHVPDLELTMTRLRHLLGSLSRWHGLKKGFERVAPPKAIEKPEKLRRELRYVFLNPCRDGLCSDPLEWRWSSYRQLLGAAHGQWTDDQMARACRFPGSTGLQRLHRYVSSDPSVAVTGSPFPIAAPPAMKNDTCGGSLTELFSAARAAHPEELNPDSSRIRASFIWLAMNQGWRNLGPISRFLDSEYSPILYWTRQAPAASNALLIERYCLADTRLRRWLPPR